MRFILWRLHAFGSKYCRRLALYLLSITSSNIDRATQLRPGKMQQVCSSESRAFFIIDHLSAGCLVWTKKALARLCSTLAVALKQPCPIGLAVLQQGRPGQAVSLQVCNHPAHPGLCGKVGTFSRCAVVLYCPAKQILLRLGSTFQARDFLTCINRLPPESSTPGPNGDKLSKSGFQGFVHELQSLAVGKKCMPLVTSKLQV